MNRKFSVLLIVVSLFAATLFIVGCDGDDGERGVMGLTGPSSVQTHDTAKGEHADALDDGLNNPDSITYVACAADWHAATATGGVCRDHAGKDAKGCIHPKYWDDQLSTPACI